MKTLLPLVVILFTIYGSASAQNIQSGISKDEASHFRYIDNGILRLGVDASGGGSIFYVAESATGRNLLNHFDKGRFVQQSYYGIKDGSNWNGTPWRWNPV